MGFFMILEFLKTYFPQLDSPQKALLETWAQELRSWNERLNLVSRKDIHALETHHLLPALSYLKLDFMRPSMTLLDFGTGGGLPGLPLAIARPDVNFILVDSVAKKIQAVEAMVESLGLKNVRTLCARAESLKLQVDFVIGRAVAPFSELLSWVKPLIRTGPPLGPLASGLIYMKGDHYKEELVGVTGVEAFALKSFFPEADWASGRYLVYVPASTFRK